MPYEKLQDLPGSLTDKLPRHAQEIYLAAYNNAWAEYKHSSDPQQSNSREEISHKVAWSAVKKKYYIKRTMMSG